MGRHRAMVWRGAGSLLKIWLKWDTMKKFLMSLIILMMVTSSCKATNFSSIIGIGNISGITSGGFRIEGTSYNNGTSYENGKFHKEWGKLYEKGCFSVL